MEDFVLNTADFRLLYNCSIYDVDSIPLARRQHPFLGAVTVGISTIEEILYIPCLVAIWRLSKENACYKMMFVMGVLDMLALPICGIATGIMGVFGTAYCSLPGPIYVMGCIAFCLWLAESSLEVMLAANRCLELMVSDHWRERLFGGWRAWVWTLAPIGYGLGECVFDRAVLVFNPVHFAWFFNPHAGYNVTSLPNELYIPGIQELHNWMVVVALTGTYGLFAVLFAYKVHGGGVNNNNTNGGSIDLARHKLIFIQVAIISALNCVGALVYLYMQSGQTPDWLIIVVQLVWTQIHGLPPVIYLAMNRTIRGECRRLLLVPLLKCKPAAANGAQVAATTPSPFFVPIGGGNNNSNNQAAAAGRSVSMMNRTNTWLASTIPKAIYY